MRSPAVAFVGVIRLDAATVLLQWAVGGLFFTWVTTRRREAGLGYGWMMRTTFLLVAAGAVAAGRIGDPVPVRDVASVGVVIATAVALVVSIRRRAAGVAEQRTEHDRRSARVAAMTGIERASAAPGAHVAETRTGHGVLHHKRLDAESHQNAGGATAPTRPREFPPALDLVGPAIGVVGLVAAGLAAGAGAGAGTDALAVARTLAGAAFLGAITDAMLLGHWYLVQPGLPRRLLLELVGWLGWVWPLEVGLLLVPTGMASVLSGRIDDGWGGTLGWMWVACAVTTLALVFVTRAALRERAYSAVMAATGLLYLAILTAFGTDLVARAVLT